MQSLLSVCVFSRAYEFTLQVIQVVLQIQKVLLIVAFNLNALQTAASQVFGIVYVDNIVIFFCIFVNELLTDRIFLWSLFFSVAIDISAIVSRIATTRVALLIECFSLLLWYAAAAEVLANKELIFVR